MSDKKGGEMALVIAAELPSMIVKFGVGYLRLRRRANRSSRQFYEVLLRNGVPRHEAKGLADEYASMFSLRTILRGFK